MNRVPGSSLTVTLCNCRGGPPTMSPWTYFATRVVFSARGWPCLSSLSQTRSRMSISTFGVVMYCCTVSFEVIRMLAGCPSSSLSSSSESGSGSFPPGVASLGVNRVGCDACVGFSTGLRGGGGACPRGVGSSSLGSTVSAACLASCSSCSTSTGVHCIGVPAPLAAHIHGDRTLRQRGQRVKHTSGFKKCPKSTQSAWNRHSAGGISPCPLSRLDSHLSLDDASQAPCPVYSGCTRGSEPAMGVSTERGYGAEHVKSVVGGVQW